MLEPHIVEEIICIVSAMDRDAVVERLLSFDGDFPVDFTPRFLAGLNDDRLRHLLVALCMQTRTVPTEWASVAA